MPIYEYLCDKCGHQFDEIRQIQDSNTSQCRCGEWAEKLPSAIGGYNGNFSSASTAPRKKASRNKLRFKEKKEDVS